MKLENQVALNIINAQVTLPPELTNRINQLDKYQCYGLIQALFGNYNVFLTTGSPGAGKTTLLLLVKELCELLGYAVLAVAPYGTAAKQIGGLTLGSAFNKIDHFLPRKEDGTYIHYKVGSDRRLHIGKKQIDKLSKLIGSKRTVKIILDEFSSFTSEELLAFKDAIKLTCGGKSVSYLAYGQPLQTLAYDVSKSKQELNYASAPWSEAKFKVSETDTIKLSSFFTNTSNWVVKYHTLRGMHRCADDVAFTNCLRMLEEGKKVENTEEWKPLTDCFTNITPKSNTATYIVTYNETKSYNNNALLGKATVKYNAFFKYKGYQGHIMSVDYKAHTIELVDNNGNFVNINVPSVIINYLKETDQPAIQELALGLPYMSWVNDSRLDIQNGTKGIITDFTDNSIEVDGKEWTYVQAQDVPVDDNGNPMFTYSMLPGNLAVAMTSRKVLGATITGQVIYRLPNHSESGIVYVCCSRVTKASDLSIIINASTKEEMIAKFNQALCFSASAKAFWSHVQANQATDTFTTVASKSNTVVTPPPIENKHEVIMKTPEFEYPALEQVDLKDVLGEYKLVATYPNAVIVTLNDLGIVFGELHPDMDFENVYVHCLEIPEQFKVTKSVEPKVTKPTKLVKALPEVSKVAITVGTKVYNVDTLVTETVKGIPDSKTSTDTVKVTKIDNNWYFYVKDLVDIESFPKLEEERWRDRFVNSGRCFITLVKPKTEEPEQLEVVKPQSTNSIYTWARYSSNNYEVSTKGDKRFSALCARLSDGRTIEEAYQLDVKGYRVQGNNWKLGKGKPPITNITKEEQWLQYKALWRTYLAENPSLFEELTEKAKGKVLTDMFASTGISQARALAELLNELIVEPVVEPTVNSELEDLKAQLALEQAKSANLASQLTEANEIINTCKHRISILEENEVNLQKDLETSRKTTSTWQSKCTKLEAELAEAKETIAKLEAKTQPSVVSTKDLVDKLVANPEALVNFIDSLESVKTEVVEEPIKEVIEPEVVVIDKVIESEISDTLVPVVEDISISNFRVIEGKPLYSYVTKEGLPVGYMIDNIFLSNVVESNDFYTCYVEGNMIVYTLLDEYYCDSLPTIEDHAFLAKQEGMELLVYLYNDYIECVAEEEETVASLDLTIISGGQTGADQGGLEAAYLENIPTGGLMPKGFKTELGSNKLVADKYNLKEDSSTSYVPRTHKNSANADVTLWFGYTNSPGYYCTLKGCEKANKKLVDCTDLEPSQIADLIKQNNYKVINIAGNRESKNHGLFQKVVNKMRAVIRLLKV